MRNYSNTEIAKQLENCQSFSDILNIVSTKVPEDIYLIEGANSYSFREFNELVNRCCYYYQSIGLKAGDVISLVLRNSTDYLIHYFSAIRYGLILNPFPSHISAEELVSRLYLTSPAIVFTHKTHYKQLAKTKYNTINLDDFETSDFSDFLLQYSAEEFSTTNNPNSTAVLYYSSGTTGDPKIIEYSHESMVQTQLSMVRAGFSKPGSVHLCALPLGHTASLRYTVKQCMCTGSTVVLYESFWKIRSKIWDEVEKYGVNFFQVVPSVLVSILNTPYKNFRKEQVKTLDFIGCGSSYLPNYIQNAFIKKFLTPISNLYGLSETGATHFDDPTDPNRVKGSIGKPFDVMDVKIFNSDHEEVGVGETGEFGIRGVGLLSNYYNNDKLYNKTIVNGYFMTGDLGKIDSNGIYYYVDRIKDLIIKGGVNVVPAQIDEVLISHPYVMEAATIGIPDMFLGEDIMSYVVVSDNEQVSESELKDYCNQKLGDFKTPSKIETLDALPKGYSGKILKKDLRELAEKA